MNILEQLSITSEGIIETESGILLSGSRVIVHLPEIPVRYLYSGWQSWSLTAWVDMDRPIRPIRPPSSRSIHADPVYAREIRPNGSYYGAIEFADGQLLFLGALGLESHILLDGLVLSGIYENGTGKWLLASGDETEIMSCYAELLGKSLVKSPNLLSKNRFTPSSTQRVWCSWYSFYTEIHEKQLLKVLDDLGKIGSSTSLPFDVFQVDDGWQRAIGDWEPNAKFPSGMGALTEQIKQSGRKAGLWLAPLLIVRSSSLYKEHFDWLLKDERGKPVSAGFNWGEQLFALDTSHPAVLDWLSILMNKVRYWGYDYLKLDFLYAGALPGIHRVNMPREAAYRLGLKTIRSALGNAYLLVCGAPILPSLGLCDGMRVGPDVAGSYNSFLGDDLLMDFAMPGARNALRTSFNRLWMQPLVDVDPDVVYFRSKWISLSPFQRQLLQDLAQISNFKSCSDIPTWLTDSERAYLSRFLVTKPIVTKTGRTEYLVGERKVNFGPHLVMPRLPGKIIEHLGAMLGSLGKIHFLMKMFAILEKILVKRFANKYSA